MAASPPSSHPSSDAQHATCLAPIGIEVKRKRKRSCREYTTLRERPSEKRLRTDEQPSQKTPSALFDNLSRLWLVPRALREFDRRISRPKNPRRPRSHHIRADELTALKRFARLGGPYLDDIRSYPEHFKTAPPVQDMDSQGRQETARVGSLIRKSSAYDPLFEQNLIDHGVYPDGYDLEDESDVALPGNIYDINAALRRPRPSLSPSTFTSAEFQRFKKENLSAKTETGVMSTAFRTIVGESDIPNQQNIKFNNLAPLTDGNITQGQPDFYDGARPADVSLRIRKELGFHIVPSTNTSNPCVPNFFAEGKGPSGNAAVSKRQACYDGALGARAVHELQKYTNPETAFDNGAYTISSTYVGGAGGGFLTLYATHLTPSESQQREVEYHMTQLRSFAMTDSLDAFREGAKCFRNARDWTHEQRQELIAAANAKSQAAALRTNRTSMSGHGEASAVPASNSSLPPSYASGAAVNEPEMSPDELSLDVDPLAKRAGRNANLSHKSYQRRQTSAGLSVSGSRVTATRTAPTAKRTTRRSLATSRKVVTHPTPSTP